MSSMPRGRRRAPPNQNVHYKILGTRKKGERSSLFRVLARTPFNSSVLLPFFPTLTLPPPRCGRLQARRRTELLPAGSTCHIDLRAALSPRLDARALRLRWSCARTPKSGLLVPVQRPTDGAGVRARALQGVG
jgi:hypothetical protein